MKEKESLIPPKNSITLSWNNLTLTSNSKPVLSDLSGYANPGEILSIIGTSGSGKTSFLSTLSAVNLNLPNSCLTGSLYLNKIPYKSLSVSKYISYLPQDSVLFPTLTVYETLEFVSKIKHKLPFKQRNQVIQDILTDLNMEKIANSLVGNNSLRGISGGEKKRLCIAVQILLDAPVFIMDEPLSGLDSRLCKIVFHILLGLKSKGKTLILTVHQPSKWVFENSDRVVLMCEGKFIYQGKVEEMKGSFSKIGFFCPEWSNEAEYYIKISYVRDRNNLTELELKTLKMFDEQYQKLELFKGIDKSNPEVNLKENNGNSWNAFLALLSRSWKNMLRNPHLFLVKAIQLTVYGLVYILMFWDMGYDQQGIEDRRCLIASYSYGLISLNFFPLSMVINTEKSIVEKEVRENLYGVGYYLLSKIFIELLLQLLFYAILNPLIYFPSNLNLVSADKFFIFMLISFLSTCLSLVLSYCFGMACPNHKAVAYFSPVINVPMIMYSGIFNNDSSRSESFAWLKYISPYYYVYRALVINEFNELNYDSDVNPTPEKRLDVNLSESLELYVLSLCLFTITLFVLFLIIARLKIV